MSGDIFGNQSYFNPCKQTCWFNLDTKTTPLLFSMYLQLKMRYLYSELSTCSNTNVFNDEPTTTARCKFMYSICLNNEPRTLSNL